MFVKPRICFSLSFITIQDAFDIVDLNSVQRVRVLHVNFVKGMHDSPQVSRSLVVRVPMTYLREVHVIGSKTRAFFSPSFYARVMIYISSWSVLINRLRLLKKIQ